VNINQIHRRWSAERSEVGAPGVSFTWVLHVFDLPLFVPRSPDNRID